MSRLWEERVKGDGDMEIEVNGIQTTAHWCLLQHVPYFQQLKQQQTPSLDKPTHLTIEDNSISLQSLVKALKYIYTDYCFTSDRGVAEFHNFCQFAEIQSLAFDSFSLAMQSITQSNCVLYFQLGKAYQLSPLKQKTWKTAIKNKWIAQVREMIASPLDLDMPLTTEQQTALHLSLDSLVLAHALISAGADVNRADHKGITPLGLAVWTGRYQLTELLIKSGADINTTDQWGQTPLHKACAKGLDRIIKLLLTQEADANLTSKDGYTPLHMAAIGGHQRAVLLLLQHGAVWRDRDFHWQKTALHMAAMKGHVGLVKLLLQLDTNQARQEVGRECLTPLHTAVKFGYCAVVRILLEHGVPANAKDWEGRTPVHYAAKSGNTEALEMLIRAGGGLYKQDNYKMTCLHLAAKTNHINSVSLLLTQQNCPTNVVDKYGLTALHYAAENRNTNMVRQLLRSGAVPTILSNDGKIARNLRGKKKHLDTLKFLIMARS